MTGNSMLSKLLSTETRGELLILFRKNPGLIDTSEGVARRIGRQSKNIEAELKDFVELGLLKTKRIGISDIFYLNTERDKEIQEIVTAHISSLGDARS